MLHPSPIDWTVDTDFVLEMHCLANYDSDSPVGLAVPYEEYRARWLAGGQPAVFLEAAKKSIEDPRTIAEVWQDEGERVGFLWVWFHEIPGWRGITGSYGEICDVGVVPVRRRQGIATQMFEHAEAAARALGAALLRSSTGVANLASQGLHEKQGFHAWHLDYEKWLSDPDS